MSSLPAPGSGLLAAWMAAANTPPRPARTYVSTDSMSTAPAAPPRRAPPSPSASAAAAWSDVRPVSWLAGSSPTREKAPACSRSAADATCIAPLPAAPSTDTDSVRACPSASASMATSREASSSWASNGARAPCGSACAAT